MIDFIDLVVTEANAVQIADDINAAFAAGECWGVNGREAKSAWGQPIARSWQNGTVSVTVKGREKRTTGTVYVKVGQRLRAHCTPA